MGQVQCFHCYGSGIVPVGENDPVIECRVCRGSGYVHEYEPATRSHRSVSSGPAVSSGASATKSFSILTAILCGGFCFCCLVGKGSPNPIPGTLLVTVLCGFFHKFVKFIVAAFILLMILGLVMKK